jgi:estrogen-related receptor beta like 1
MSLKEKYMNNQFTALCSEYKEVKQQYEQHEIKSKELNEKISKLTNELTEITEKLEELKESYESRDSGIHDTSPLVRIKASLKQIKAEIHSFDLRIGVVSQTLMAARVSIANRKRIAAAQKARLRRGKGATNRGLRGSSDRNNDLGDDDSILSGGD